jgi:hypothetical protein
MERLILAHSFRGFSPCSLGSIVSGPVERQKEAPQWRTGGGAKMLNLYQLGEGKEEREREREREHARSS